ncbi:MAG: transcriptional regulator [Rhodobacteraceae bacterium]|nr:transcriptional regulator [Paracoccaceae bacterium]MAY44217.1 transcriptional regulator [Paracoccaceae bacterium]|tara:strand:- start:45 stop:479 length:435 start_codon:yes stop_codon:yes gene_type:complete
MDPVYKAFLTEVFGLVRGIRKRFNARAAAMDMTYARALAISHVSREPGLSQAELADLLDIRTPSMNRTLDQLEEAGLIERRSDPQDKRVRRLFLTDRAHDQAEKITGFTEDLRREAYQGIPADELAQALKTLQRIQQNLDRMED